MTRYPHLLLLLLLGALSATIHSCTKEKGLSDLELVAEPIVTFDPTDTSGGGFNCDPWQLFYRDEGVYAFRMSCAPFFNYDRVLAKAPVLRQTDKLTEGSFSGDFYALVIQRPVALSFAEAEASQSLLAAAELAKFSAFQDGSRWMCRLELEDFSLFQPAVEFRISNRNEDGSLIYKAMLVWSADDVLYQAAVFWSVLEE